MARVEDLWAVYPDRRGRGKRWLSIWIDPTGRERSQAFSKKGDAERYASRMETEIAQGAYIDPKKARITVAEWCSTWLEGYATHRSSTVRQANVHIRRIVAEFGPYPLGSLRPSQIRSWVAGLREEGLEDSYVYALHSRLAQIMSDAVHDGLLVKSPCSRRTSPHLAEQRVYVATTEQVWDLYDLFPQRTRLAILLGAFVGLRLAEACGLRPEDVDFMRGSRASEGAVSGAAAQDQDFPDTGSDPSIAGGRAVRADRRVWPSRNPADRRERPPAITMGDRAGDAESPPEGAGPFGGLPLPRSAALLRQPAHRLGRGRQDRAGAPAARQCHDHARHLRAHLARPGRVHPRRCRGCSHCPDGTAAEQCCGLPDNGAGQIQSGGYTSK